MTRCMNCYTTQGPFERQVIRGPINIVLIGCARGRLVTIDDQKHYEGIHACNRRREKFDQQRYPGTL